MSRKKNSSSDVDKKHTNEEKLLVEMELSKTDDKDLD